MKTLFCFLLFAASLPLSAQSIVVSTPVKDDGKIVTLRPSFANSDRTIAPRNATGTHTAEKAPC